ncbi:MAG TPA: ribosome-associated translation inhibitor RaiA [Bacillota bacterium]|nr:ribosome-associated translation inhibitor RaiA [Bacillota bacterium]
MNINVRGKNVEVTDALKDYVRKRIGKLEKYLGAVKEVQVTLVVEKNLHRVEVTIPINGMIIRGEEATPDMYSSVDLVFEKLEKQLNKYRGKISKKLRNLNIPHEEYVPAPTEKLEPDEVVKTKRFAVKPMAVEEAVAQMNLIGHSFYVFSNSDTDEVNVVYRRNDGKYGLIEPEY